MKIVEASEFPLQSIEDPLWFVPKCKEKEDNESSNYVPILDYKNIKYSEETK
jgi:hypothetical protein